MKLYDLAGLKKKLLEEMLKLLRIDGFREVVQCVCDQSYERSLPQFLSFFASIYSPCSANVHD